MTVTFVIETMACANAIFYWGRMEQLKRQRELDGVRKQFFICYSTFYLFFFSSTFATVMPFRRHQISMHWTTMTTSIQRTPTSFYQIRINSAIAPTTRRSSTCHCFLNVRGTMKSIRKLNWSIWHEFSSTILVVHYFSCALLFTCMEICQFMQRRSLKHYGMLFGECPSKSLLIRLNIEILSFPFSVPALEIAHFSMSPMTSWTGSRVGVVILTMIIGNILPAWIVIDVRWSDLSHCLGHLRFSMYKKRNTSKCARFYCDGWPFRSW